MDQQSLALCGYFVSNTMRTNNEARVADREFELARERKQAALAQSGTPARPGFLGLLLGSLARALAKGDTTAKSPGATAQPELS